MTLVLSREHLGAVEDHALREFPRECCGVLLGTASTPEYSVREVVWCSNEIAGRHDRYRIPASELIAAQKRARARGMDIVGFYHSHPDHPPQWSSTDLAEAHWFGCVYLIVAVTQGVAGARRAFLLEGNEPEKRFSELQIRVHP